MKPSKPKEQTQAQSLPAKVRPELNIEKWSIWQPANSRSAPKARIFEREVQLPDGSKVVAKVEIAPTTRGNLTTEDQKVYYALIKQWEDRGRPSEFTSFSIQRLAKLLRKPWGKNTREALTASLARLRLTGFIWEHSYEDKTTGRVLSRLDFFNLLSDLKIVRSRDEGTVNREVGYFRFHDAIVKNLLAHHTKPILFDVVLSFTSEIAQILYTYLDLILSDKTCYERRTKELFEDLGLEGKDYQKLSARIRRLEPALKELQGVELTTGRIIKAALEKTKDGTDFKLVVRKGKVTRALTVEGESQPLAEVIALPTPNKQARDAEELVKHFHSVFHGTDKAFPTNKALDQAATLIAQFGVEKARHVIDFARREAKMTGHKIATFGGVMQYTSQAARDFEKRGEDRKREELASRAKVAETTQRKRAEAEQSAEEVAFSEFWETLSTDEREAFKAEALAKAPEYHLSFQLRRYNQQTNKETDSALATLRIMLVCHFQTTRPAGR